MKRNEAIDKLSFLLFIQNDDFTNIEKAKEILDFIEEELKMVHVRKNPEYKGTLLDLAENIQEFLCGWEE